MTDHEVTCGTCGSSTWMEPNQNGDVFCRACFQEALLLENGGHFTDHRNSPGRFSMGTTVKSDDVADLG